MIKYDPKLKEEARRLRAQMTDPAAADSRRDPHLGSEGLPVLRFGNLQVLKEIEGVMGPIRRAVAESLGGNPP